MLPRKPDRVDVTRIPERIQLRRTKGWRKPEGAIVVARPTRWGNPWCIVPVQDWHFDFGDAANVSHIDGDRHAGRFPRRTPVPGIGGKPYWEGIGAPYWAMQMYRSHLGENPDLIDAARRELHGRDLACWCRLDQPCHADVLLEIANQEAR